MKKPPLTDLAGSCESQAISGAFWLKRADPARRERTALVYRELSRVAAEIAKRLEDGEVGT